MDQEDENHPTGGDGPAPPSTAVSPALIEALGQSLMPAILSALQQQRQVGDGEAAGPRGSAAVPSSATLTADNQAGGQTTTPIGGCPIGPPGLHASTTQGASSAPGNAAAHVGSAADHFGNAASHAGNTASYFGNAANHSGNAAGSVSNAAYYSYHPSGALMQFPPPPQPYWGEPSHQQWFPSPISIPNYMPYWQSGPPSAQTPRRGNHLGYLIHPPHPHKLRPRQRNQLRML